MCSCPEGLAQDRSDIPLMAPPALRHKGRLFPPLVISSILAAGGAEAQTTARWYIGTYTNDVLVWDEASEQVIDRITMRNPIPTGITMSEAKDRLYVRDASSQVIEVVDVAAGEVIDEFTLSEDSVSVRINSLHLIHQTKKRSYR